MACTKILESLLNTTIVKLVIVHIQHCPVECPLLLCLEKVYVLAPYHPITFPIPSLILSKLPLIHLHFISRVSSLHLSLTINLFARFSIEELEGLGQNKKAKRDKTRTTRANEQQSNNTFQTKYKQNNFKNCKQKNQTN